MHLSARIYVCDNKELRIKGFTRTYQNVEKNINIDDEYYFSLFYSLMEHEPIRGRHNYELLSIQPRKQLCLVVGATTVFWSPYNVLSAPVVIEEKLLYEALEEYLDKGEKEAQPD